MAAPNPHQDATATSPNPISHVFGIDQQQLSDRLAKYKPIDVFMRPAPSNGSPAGPGQPIPHSKKILEKWEPRLPRFLFRGFKSRSGGNPGLNRSRLIQPHAFYGTGKRVESWPGERDGSPAASIDVEKLRTEINGHLSGAQRVSTHFSSWAADLQTAISYAGSPSRVDDSPMIAVLDTALCDARYTAIYHVPALKAAGVAHTDYPDEYLVYGPVVGAAYCCCVPVSSLLREGSHRHYSLVAKRPRAATQVTTGDLDQASKIASLFRHEMYKVAGPALFLTVFAAELCRSCIQPAHHTAKSEFAWSRDDTIMILNYLRPRIYDASLCDYQPLVNPKTYVTGFRQLRCMVQLLMSVDEAIQMTRSEWAVKLQPKQDVTCPTESSSSHGKRKANSDPSTRPLKKVYIKSEDETRGAGLARSQGAKSGPAGGSSLLTARDARARRRARRA